MTTTHAIPAVTLELAANYDQDYLVPPVVTWGVRGGYFDQPTPMFLDKLNTFLFSPISAFVTLYNAKPGEVAEFAIDGDLVALGVVQNDRSCRLMVTSGVLTAGVHELTATVDGITVMTSLGIKRGPNIPLEPIDADRPPEIVPEAIQDSGNYRWVLQDLAIQGGIGSWVMPFNPVSMTPLPKKRTLTPAPTTSVLNGQVHITEAMPAPVEWSFSGFCPDYEFYAKLTSYYELNRRFYLIDHRNRAWTVTFSNLEMTPRKRGRDDDGTFNDWRHDYVVSAVIYAQEPKTPE